MAKFYVQSGSERFLIDTCDVSKAALWAVQRSMQDIASYYEDDSLSANQKADCAFIEGLIRLDDFIQISEKGFDRDDAVFVSSFDVILEWHQLMIALDRLSGLL